MKRTVIYVLVAVIAVAFAAGAMAMDHDSNGAMGCHYCGMNLHKFANSAIDITYEDGTVVKVCSLHCAALDLAVNMGRTPKSIMVGDFKTRKKIDAEKAFWVVDSSNPGVMTSRGKWAFRNKSDAEGYIKDNSKGASMVSFEEALKAAYEDMYKDTMMIRNKRKTMKMKGM